jgi:hypothetical protein
MSNELKRIEGSVNTIVGKPVAWFVLGLLVLTRYGFRAIVRCASWLKPRHVSS